MKTLLTLMLCAVLAVGSTEKAPAPKPEHKIVDQQLGYMIWDSTCFGNLVKVEDTKIIAPYVDGAPDMSQLMIVGVQVEHFVPGCGRLEIRIKK